jgi:hypothetical protein
MSSIKNKINAANNFLFLFFQEKKKGKKKLEKVYKVGKHLLILKNYSTDLIKDSKIFTLFAFLQHPI